MRRQPTMRERIAARIAKRRDDAFLTAEFRDLGGERQVLRGLRELVDNGQLTDWAMAPMAGLKFRR